MYLFFSIILFFVSFLCATGILISAYLLLKDIKDNYYFIGIILICGMIFYMSSITGLSCFQTIKTVRLNHYEKLKEIKNEYSIYEKEIDDILFCVNSDFTERFIHCQIDISATSLDDDKKRDDILKIIKKAGFYGKFKMTRFCNDTNLSGSKGIIKQCNYHNAVLIY